MIAKKKLLFLNKNCFQEDGCKEGVCCCSTGDYCNGAAGSGIISAFLVAATAWLRL